MAKIVAVSGGFDPLHVGHVRYIEEAANHGDVHIYLNTDEWLIRKKGYVFMPFKERAEILWALKGVSLIIPAMDEDGTVCRNLETFRPDFFAKGGDRGPDNTPESQTCERLGIQILYGIGGDKIQSSSELAINARTEISRR